MTTTHAHKCVYFDDGETDLLCVCGRRALALVGEDGAEPLLVRISDDHDRPRLGAAVVTPLRTRHAQPNDLAVSA